MGRHKLLHEQISRIHSFERDRYKEFSELCKEQEVSVSEGLRNLIEKELEKKALGASREANPCNISYITNITESKNYFQSDLMQWVSHVDEVTEQNELNRIKGQALEIARRTDKRSMELRFNDLKR